MPKKAIVYDCQVSEATDARTDVIVNASRACQFSGDRCIDSHIDHIII